MAPKTGLWQVRRVEGGLPTMGLKRESFGLGNEG